MIPSSSDGNSDTFSFRKPVPISSLLSMWSPLRSISLKAVSAECLASCIWIASLSSAWRSFGLWMLSIMASSHSMSSLPLMASVLTIGGNGVLISDASPAPPTICMPPACSALERLRPLSGVSGRPPLIFTSFDGAFSLGALLELLTFSMPFTGSELLATPLAGTLPPFFGPPKMSATAVADLLRNDLRWSIGSEALARVSSISANSS
mmetsp:Transcript_20677/g.54242  ORF Transcript_20677/g.54242 Transcript_20677/m.54242 type:complete len:208 (-) Transcript_20677:539-1162(-)